MDFDKTTLARLRMAEDHVLVREGLRAMLSGEPDLEVVGEAENGRIAVNMCRSLNPNLVLMGVRMPEMDGLEATPSTSSIPCLANIGTPPSATCSTLSTPGMKSGEDSRVEWFPQPVGTVDTYASKGELTACWLERYPVRFQKKIRRSISLSTIRAPICM